jgi:hypothetical protein
MGLARRRVEDRVEQHLERLGDRLQRVGLAKPSDTGKDTAVAASPKKEAPRELGTESGDVTWDEWAMRDLNPRPRACEARALTS